MNENATTQQPTAAIRSTSRVTVNFVLPEGVNPSTITLDNYRKVTGARFRMTKDQMKVRGISRAVAFEESKSLAIAQLGQTGL